jgi:cytochrome c-type biogenesis protein CcmH
LAIALLTLLCVAWSRPSQAEDEATPEWGYALSSELMSPYCPGRALPDCPSPQATELRQWIVGQARDGRSKDEVMAQLLERFGEQMLQRPRASGFGLAAYAIPVVGVVVGGAALAFFLRRQRAELAATPAAALPSAPLDPDLERKVDEEFRRAKEDA